MCGIFGIIELDRRPAEQKTAAVHKGIAMLRHRGPDEIGVETRGSVCFGHARLSIIDLNSGQQPMWSTDRAGLICYNGEVYNFPELRKELSNCGHNFKTRSDTEVVLNAYLEWGEKSVPRLRGMFAFAAVDFKENRVIIARDRLGKKPLFYTIQDKTLYFSSELEPLYKIIGSLKIDLEALDDYLYWQYIHAPKTIYGGVKSLPPAHLINIDLNSGKIEEKRYWNLQFCEDRSLSLDEWQQKLDGIIKESVKIRLISDVPFGAFLSGGIDSSLVTGYMAEILDQPVRTFSIGFKEADFSELQYAEKVAEINTTEHHTEIVEADSLSLLPLLVRHYGQPFADSSAIPTYYVSKMARKYVKMVLSGDGGDESFAGYNSYEYIMQQIDKKPENSHQSRRRRLLSLGYGLINWFMKFIVGSDPLLDRAYELHIGTAHHFPTPARKALFRDCYKQVVSEHNPQRRKLMEVGRQPLISSLQNLDLMAYLPFDILTKVDIAAMANSLEVRCPLLDHFVVETAATIPAEFKLKTVRNDGNILYEKKLILRNIAKKRYPPEIIDRPKMGFGIPLGRWFANQLNQEIRKRLLDSDLLPVFFNLEEIRKLIESHSESADYSARIWNLLFLEEWLRAHSDAI